MLDPLHVTYRVEIETVTPLHIGSGVDLLCGHDLVAPFRSRLAYRVDQNRLLQDKLEVYERSENSTMLERLLQGSPSGDLLSRSDHGEHPEYFRYTLPGAPLPTDQPVKEQMKDVCDRPYIPGSSLKGALRTALFWGSYRQREAQPPDMSGLGGDRRYAAQPLEKGFFGRDSYHDWLRALHVEDCGVDGENLLELLLAGIYRSHAPQRDSVPIWLEAIRPGARFEGAVTIEQYGLRDAAARQELGWGGRDQWFASLVPLANALARHRIAHERAFYADLPALAAAYADLTVRLARLEPNECLLQVGFGAGWESKTLGYALVHQDDADFERLIRRYRLSEKHRRQPGDPFPLTRALVREGGSFVAPLGWIRLRLEGYEPAADIPSLEEATGPETPRPRRPRRPEDLAPGMVLDGGVRCTVPYGAFVDLGVGRDGLVHVSQLTGDWVDRVEDVVQPGQHVRVKVLEVRREGEKWRIGLSMKGVEQPREE